MCIIKRNINESSRSDPAPRETQITGAKKPMKSSHKFQQVEDDSSDNDTEVTAHAMTGQDPKPWNHPAGLKFPCLLASHKHEVSTCSEFFNLSLVDRWKKIEKGRMCFSCLKPRNICKGRKYTNVSSVPEVLKCAICASWAESKGLAPFSIFFWKQKQHGDSRAQLADLRKELEKYIGKLGSTVVDSKIQFSVNFMFRNSKKKKSATLKKSNIDAGNLSPAPTLDSESGAKVSDSNNNVYPESSENVIYLMQNLKIWNSNCLTFLDSGANIHLIDGKLAEKEKLQRISDNNSALGLIGGGTITTGFGNFRFN